MTIKISYDSELIESAILSEIMRRERQGDLSLFDAYHKLLDPIYEMSSQDKQEEAFKKFHHKFFQKLGFNKIIKKILTEFPSIKSFEGLVYFKKTLSISDEGSDIFAQREKGLKNIIIAICPNNFSDSTYLEKFLRHELMHISDILDKKFGYVAEECKIFIKEHWNRERYKVIWDIYIDSRLIRQGKETIVSKDERLGEFQSVYRKIPSPQIEDIFENLWNTAKLTHNEIFEMVMDTKALFKRTTKSRPLNEDEEDIVLLSGMPCPLCNFPTYKWPEDLIKNLEEKVRLLIKENHPVWEPRDGACERCLEGYRMTAGYW